MLAFIFALVGILGAFQILSAQGWGAMMGALIGMIFIVLGVFISFISLSISLSTKEKLLAIDWISISLNSISILTLLWQIVLVKFL